MHMADALLSPEVGGSMWAASGAVLAWSAKKINSEMDSRKIPLMGVLGAFIFAAQMINFAIPGTGSSGHLGGGMILAALLGPPAGFLVMASILTVQALFFADGGILALGCNIFNLGFFPCFVAYPLIFRVIAGNKLSHGRIAAASIISAIIALQLGSLFVVLETVLSGVSELTFRSFITVMQPIHLAIGFIEGVVTSIVAVD
jgi:cobalt/nickel transport system permease protein